MRLTESERLKPLHDRAKGGDLKAGRELIAACRRGMLAPEWEKQAKIDSEVVEKHVKRREGALSGKAVK